MRPHEPEQWNWKHLYSAYCLSIAIGMILVSVALTVIIIAFFGALKTRADDHPLCTYFKELSTQPGVSVAVWVGYPEGWKDYPQQWDYETYTDLPAGSGILSRTVDNETWLWGFRSLTEDNGHHDFCEHVLIVDDSP